jgi:membrane-bound lytic murein transglycosylase B
MKVSATIISVSLMLFLSCLGCSKEERSPPSAQNYKVVMPIKRPAPEKATTSSTGISLEQQQHSIFRTWLESFRKEALDSGISQKTLDAAFSGLEPIPEVIERDRCQPEFKLTLNQYLHAMVSENRIAEGRKKLQENGTLLNRVASRYGLQPRFVVALWGIETDFGSSNDSFPVIGSLATLAYDSRRSSFFRKELMHALRILDEGHMSLAQMKGSWAGAMGQLQFIPSAFHHFAVDYDGDGRMDIWKGCGDVFASAANYLMRCGWKRDQTWGHEVCLPNGLDRALIGFEYQKRLSEWQALGVRCLDGQDLPTLDILSSIIQPDGSAGRAFLVYSNYRCILKWNRSPNFAIAVGILSDRIGSLKGSTEIHALKD